MSNIKYKILNTKYLSLSCLFLTAFLERVALDLGPNIELVTMAMVLSAFYVGRKESFWITFAIIAISDRLIGNSNIFLFTWSGFLIPALLSKNLIKFLDKIQSLLLKSSKRIAFTIPLLVTGFAANFFFYFWTNFGVWFLDSFNMYPNTLNGLIRSYINGLPFLKLQMTSTFIFIPLGFFITEIMINLSGKWAARHIPKALSHFIE